MNQHPDYVLNKINGPKDLKKLSFEELSKLPDEMRQLVLEKMPQSAVTSDRILESWK